MTVPTRPVSHASIESVWGQAVHDWTFTPSGTGLYGTAATTCGATMTQVRLDGAIEDPGGWLDASPLPGTAVAPTGSDGLYLLTCRVNTVNGTAGEFTRARIEVNGTPINYFIATNAGGTNIAFSVADVVTVTAGDIFTVSAQRIGSVSPSVTVNTFYLIRLGDAIGA
jgi:hypothetical protein